MTLFPGYAELFQAVDHHTVVITANQRLSRFLLSQWHIWQSSLRTQTETSQTQVWPELNCLSLPLWLERIWQQLLLNGLAEAEVKTLLLPHQQRKLWADIVAEALADSPILSADSVVESVMQGWKSLRLWCKSLDDLTDDSPETQLFNKCVSAFEQRCEQNAWMDEVQRTQIIIGQSVQLQHLPLKRLILVGFDNLSPLEQTLLRLLQDQNIQLEYFNLQLESHCQSAALADHQEEIRKAATWASSLLRQHLEQNLAPPRIGLVVPDLAQRRAQVHSILNEVFEPQILKLGQTRHAPGFNISAAQPLAQTPLMASALLALKLFGQEVEVKDLCQILSSPFLWSTQHWRQRLYLAQQLTRDYAKVSVPKCIEFAQKLTEKSDQPWVQQLQDFEREAHPCRFKKMTFQRWAEIFNSTVQKLGFPGPRTLDTLEFQQASHWPHLLQQLAELDLVQGEAVTGQQALSELNRLAYTPFHPQTETSPVQVLGLLEAAGMQFDYLWVMGLDYRVWPEPTKPNPLLPLRLQKSWDMPRASAQRELTLAKTLTERLQTSAYQVIFSFPQMDGDQPLRISPLLESLSVIKPEQITGESLPNHAQLNPPQALEQVLDYRAPPVSQTGNYRGGTGLIKNQALCPFKAFAEHRLLALAKETYQEGITGLIRGDLIHKALEMIWRQLRTQEKLLALSDADLRNVIVLSVQAAWAQLKSVALIGARVRELECQRSCELISQWLDIEKQRQPFVVQFQERSQQFDLDGLVLQLRYDRIDHILATDQLMVIDYKTGQTDIKKWFGARPEEPQIPLYVLMNEAQISAAAFAQINRHELAIKGITAGEEMDSLQGVSALEKWDMPTSWAELVRHWDITLKQLARNFFEGHAEVDPKAIQVTCTYCQLKNLCRINDDNSVAMGDQTGD